MKMLNKKFKYSIFSFNLLTLILVGISHLVLEALYEHLYSEMLFLGHESAHNAYLYVLNFTEFVFACLVVAAFLSIVRDTLSSLLNRQTQGRG